MSVKIEYDTPIKPPIKKVIVELDEKDFLYLGAVCGKLAYGNKTVYNLYVAATDYFGRNVVNNVFTDDSYLHTKDSQKFIDR